MDGSTQRVARILATCNDNPEFPLVADVILVGDRIKPGMPFFGIYGKFAAEHYPFVMRPDGTLDFGHEYGDDRYMKCTMRDRDVVLGEYVTLDGATSNGPGTYRIVKVERLT